MLIPIAVIGGLAGVVKVLGDRFIEPGVWCWPWQDPYRIKQERVQGMNVRRQREMYQNEAYLRFQDEMMRGMLGLGPRPTEILACTGEDACACEPCKADRARRQKAKAEFRAHDLLLEKLSPEQQAEWKKDRFFTVTTAGKRRYRIRGTHRRSFNVFLLDDAGKETKSFCATKYGDLPLHDLLLTQKLALETDEAGFLLTANVRNERGGGFGIAPGMMPDLVIGGHDLQPGAYPPNIGYGVGQANPR